MSYIWRLVECSGQKPLGRSSHSMDVIRNVVYIMGGEHEPRVPIGSTVWCLDLSSKTWNQLETKGDEVPARNAHASAVVNSSIYIFGGRQGIAMGEGSLCDMYELKTDTGVWTKVTMNGEVPEARSYHSMTAVGSKLYVFGGCSVRGRHNDLHCFDTDTGVWQTLPSSDNIAGRGGAGLTSVGRKLYVVGGFAGKEMGDMHEFDTELCQWREIKVTPSLPPRSVFGVASLGNQVIVIGGEVDPSSLGHAGAGQFSDEVYVFDTQNDDRGWRKVTPGTTQLSPRGWFPASAASKSEVVIFGGNALDNSRLDDTLILQAIK